MSALTVQSLAAELLAYLAPACDRAEIAGSLRRSKPDPKDIEIVSVPTIFQEMATVDLFGTPGTPIMHNSLDHALDRLYANGTGTWTLDPILRRNGPKYKRLKHWGSGVCCDLFITGAAQWGVIFAIRTGPADFSRELVTRALRLGMKVADGQLWRTHRDGTRELVPTPEERDFFAALGLPYIEPGQRGRAVLA